MTPFYKNNAFWAQLVLWVSLSMMPLMSIEPDEEMTTIIYFRRLDVPAAMLVVFYINYLWLAPRLLNRRNKTLSLLFVNMAMIVVLTIGLSFGIEYDHQEQRRERIEKGIDPHQRRKHIRRLHVLDIVSTFYFLSTMALLGCGIVMERRWTSSEKKRQEAEVARRETELKYLRYQMNPHFLLNTLNNIYALTAFDPAKAQEAVMELSRIMRHMLYDNQQPFVKLTDEVDFINNYVKLMKIRQPSNVEVNTNIQLPSPCSIQIAPMIIISLVENAFKHGVSLIEKSKIDISISADQKQISCVIQNSNFPKNANDQSGHGIGLEQVGRRLELIYPGKYVWEKGTNDDNTIYTSKIIIYDT